MKRMKELPPKGTPEGYVLTTTNDDVEFKPIEVDSSNIKSGEATEGQVLAADGEGGTEWKNASGETKYRHHIFAYRNDDNYLRFGIIIENSSNEVINSFEKICDNFPSSINIPINGSMRSSSKQLIIQWFSHNNQKFTPAGIDATSTSVITVEIPFNSYTLWTWQDEIVTL